MVEIFFQVLNPPNATCASGQGGMCVSQLVGLIPDNQNVLNVYPDVNIVLNFGFHLFSNLQQTFNKGRYDRFLGKHINKCFSNICALLQQLLHLHRIHLVIMHNQNHLCLVVMFPLRILQFSSLIICRYFLSLLE
jgi:hypothetical protein